MLGNEYILSVDIGTGATKAVVFDPDGAQICMARSHYPILVPQGGWSEQRPDDVLNGVIDAIGAAVELLPDGGKILGVVISSQLYSLLAVDAEGRPISNSLPWSDTRSADSAQEIRQHPGAENLHRQTGCPINALYPLAKIAWLKQNVALPENVRFISIKEYVLHNLIDRFVIDWAVASATGLFDSSRYQWNETSLSILDICPANLSELVSPRQIFTTWNKSVLARTGLPSGTPLVIGGGDGQLASVGVGGFYPGTLAVNVGTSAAARSLIDRPLLDPDGRLWTYVVDEGLWVIGGMVSSGGVVYEWLLDSLLPASKGNVAEDASALLFEQADRLVASVPPGAEGLLFVPYLSGEQCPAWRPHTRGAFLGLDFSHKREHFARAVLEGITRSIYRVTESIQTMLGRRTVEIRVTGGLAASPVWLQMGADLFGATIVVPDTTEGSAKGAAMLAAVALGVRPDLKSLADGVLPKERFEPRPEVHAFYESQYETFTRALDCSRSL